MKQGSVPLAIALAAVLLIAGHVLPQKTFAGFIYKNYVVRHDQGRDVLCEPYIVRPGDYLYKIFRRKGELAEKNFPHFAQIFRRINPHVADIDHILPGQAIFIPLKIIEKDTFSEQATGVVTIPYVTVSGLLERMAPYLSVYEIQPGDTVSGLLVESYGPYGTPRYLRGERLFRLANPDIGDLNRVYAGQRVYLVDPSIPDDITAPVRAGAEQGPPEKPVPAQRAQSAAVDALDRIASWLGAGVMRKGVYYFPRLNGGETVELDLAAHPVVSLAGRRFVTGGGMLSDEQKRAILKSWPGAEILSIEPDDLKGLLGAVAASGGGVRLRRITVRDGGVRVDVRARWILRRRTGDGDEHICINVIGHPGERTPPSLISYLKSRGVVVRELVDPAGGAYPLPAASRAVEKAEVRPLPVEHPEKWVADLVQRLGYRFLENAEIVFSYAGLRVTALAHLVSRPGSVPLVVDFGNLYGDAAGAIRDQGFNVLQVARGAAADQIARSLLNALGEPFETDPGFTAARRRSVYNTYVHIPGIWVVPPAGARPMLFTPGPLDPRLVDFLTDRGISVMAPRSAASEQGGVEGEKNAAGQAWNAGGTV